MNFQSIAERVAQINARRSVLEDELEPLLTELVQLREMCTHPNLPKREQFEECSDFCPDCGYHSYLYIV